MLDDYLRAAEADAGLLADPVEWLRARLRVVCWSKQREIIAALEPGARVVVQSCNGSGKTYLAAALALHHTVRHALTDSGTVIVGPSWGQLVDGSLRHVAMLAAAAGLDGEVVSKKFRLGGTARILWRSPPSGQSRNLLQGVHFADHTLVILEEASEIGYELWAEATGAITSGGRSCSILAIGNPLGSGTPYWDACQGGSGWRRVQIAAKDCPDFTGEAVPAAVLEALPRRAWAEQQQEMMTPAQYRSRVEGEFPDESEHALIQPEWIPRTFARPPVAWEGKEIWWSLDPARGGDGSALWERQGDRIRPAGLPAQLRSSSSPDRVCTWIAQRAHARGVKRVVVDNFGAGADFAQHLAGRGLNVWGINSGRDRSYMTSREKREFSTPASVWCFLLREMMRSDTVSIEPVPRLDEALRNLRSVPDARMKAPDKDHLISALGGSPDDLDAILGLMWYGRVGPVTRISGTGLR